MRTKANSRVLPLNLAPIDAFFRADDTTTHPMTSVIELDFGGALHEGAFKAALATALDRHPLLAAIVQRAKGNRLCWVPMTADLPRIDWGPMDQPVAIGASEAIDLTLDCGIRIWVRVGDATSRLTLQVHHACTDGTGIYRFLGDLLAVYGMETSQGGELPRLSPVDASLLRNRRRKMAAVAVEGRALKFIWLGLREALNVFGTTVTPIAPPQSPNLQLRGGVSFPGIHTVEFSHDEHQQLRQRAAAVGGMVNDLLLCEMFRTMAEWNREQGRGGLHDRLRIMMPFDLRDQHDYAMPAANMTAYTFLTRRVGACADVDTLLADMRDATARIKQGRAGTEFVDALMLAEHAPAVLPFLLRLNRCLASVTLSNVGDPSKRFTATFPRDRGRVVCGNVVLEGVRGVPPLRNLMHATVATFSYLRKLTICMRCSPLIFSDAAAESLLGTFTDNLRARAEEGRSASLAAVRKSA
ncbi:MAG TPA: hypothetical protein VIY86_15355 [Pirellulaceae bacterium]